MTTAEQPLGLRERKKRDAKRAIRQAALDLFAEHGYEAVSVEQIAAAADVSRATFFNYFPTKDAVVTDPDPEAVAALRDLCAKRHDSEPLWTALTGVLLESLSSSAGPIVAQKSLKASSPALAKALHKVSDALVVNLRDWAEQRVPEQERPLALLQLNVAMAAMHTAFEQWGVDEPYESFLALATSYLTQLAPAFIEGAS